MTTDRLDPKFTWGDRVHLRGEAELTEHDGMPRPLHEIADCEWHDHINHMARSHTQYPGRYMYTLQDSLWSWWSEDWLEMAIPDPKHDELIVEMKGDGQ